MLMIMMSISYLYSRVESVLLDGVVITEMYFKSCMSILLYCNNACALTDKARGYLRWA